MIRLFDGKTLGDCYTWLKDTKREDPRKVFTVADGMIHISGDGLGGLVTNKRYRDYHLVLEFKFGERTWQHREQAARDSGCLIHSNGQDGGYEGCWMPSIEVQIIEGGVGDFIAVGGPDESGKRVPISLTCTVGPDKDRAKGKPFGIRTESVRRSRAAASIGTAAIRIGKTRRDFAARTTWRVHTASGRASTYFATVATWKHSSTARK